MSRHSSRQGFALLAALCCLALATTMTAAFYEGIHRSLDRQQRERWRLEAVCLAEAGIERAVAALSANAAGYQGEQNTALGSQTDHERLFSVEVSPGTVSGTFAVRSVGTVRSGSAESGSVRIEATLARGPASVFRVTSWRETAR